MNVIIDSMYFPWPLTYFIQGLEEILVKGGG